MPDGHVLSIEIPHCRVTIHLRGGISGSQNQVVARLRPLTWKGNYPMPRITEELPLLSEAKQSPVIPVEKGIQEGCIAMRPYEIAFPLDAKFHSSQ